MASKPCLPVSRRRKRHGSSAPGTAAAAATANDIDFVDISTMDASEYLSRVVQQAQRLPDVLTTTTTMNRDSGGGGSASTTKARRQRQHQHHVPIEGSAASLSYLLSDRTTLVPPSTVAQVPQFSSAWVDQTLANFSQLRAYLDQLISAMGNKVERKQAVPRLQDATGWHIFCLGKQEARGNVDGYFAQDDDDDDEEEDNEDEADNEDGDGNDMGTTGNGIRQNKATKNAEVDEGEAWRHNLPENGFEPTTSLLLQLDQVMVRRVITHLVHYVQEGWHPCSAKRSIWLYALLARLEKPVHRNEAAVLYSLLQVLTTTRANNSSWSTPQDRLALARLNTLIVITGLYFEQGGGFRNVMQSPINTTNVILAST